MIRVLYFGDVVGRIGRKAVKLFIEDNKDKINPDLVIANADNISAGKGPTIKAYQELKDSGVDIMTCGDHIWDYSEVSDILEDRKSKLIRPYNYPQVCPGKGFVEVEVKGKSLVVVSMLGRTWTKEGLDSPFYKTDELIESVNSNIIIVDFHAEATSEKYAYAWDFAAKLSAIIGSHTHVQTSDCKIFKGHTAYITDAGFCGPEQSVIGVMPEDSIKVFRTGIKTSLRTAKGQAQINAVIVDIDDRTGKAIEIKTINSVFDVSQT
jgi:metallophosphoesterase (TIGR00282 family)